MALLCRLFYCFKGSLFVETAHNGLRVPNLLKAMPRALYRTKIPPRSDVCNKILAKIKIVKFTAL